MRFSMKGLLKMECTAPRVYDTLIDKIRPVGEPHFIREPFRCTTENTEIRSVEGVTSWGNFNENNKTMKYTVKTELLYHYDLGEEIEKYERDKLVIGEGCPESWFQPVDQVQEGQYWEDDYDNIGRVQAVDGDDIEIKEIEDGIVNTYDKSFFVDRARKLSTPEIEQALDQERKRRGFTMGTEYKYNGKGRTVSNGKFYYNELHDALYEDAPRGCVYEKGEFADIVDQTPDIEINGNKVEFNDHPKVGCTTIKKEVFIEQAKTITRHGVRIHRKGEDITDQILAIASHYGYEPKDKGIDGLYIEDVRISSGNMWAGNE